MCCFQKILKKKLTKTKNPYGNGGAAEKVLFTLEKIKTEHLNIKKFFNLKKN